MSIETGPWLAQTLVVLGLIGLIALVILMIVLGR